MFSAYLHICVCRTLLVLLLRCATVEEFALLQRMLNFVQGLQYYMSYEVLEKNWLLIQRTLRKVATIDEVLARHTGKLQICQLQLEEV